MIQICLEQQVYLRALAPIYGTWMFFTFFLMIISHNPIILIHTVYNKESKLLCGWHRANWLVANWQTFSKLQTRGAICILHCWRGFFSYESTPWDKAVFFLHASHIELKFPWWFFFSPETNIQICIHTLYHNVMQSYFPYDVISCIEGILKNIYYHCSALIWLPIVNRFLSVEAIDCVAC